MWASAQTYVPLALGGLNQDIIAEAATALKHTSTSVDTNGQISTVLFSNAFPHPTTQVGLPDNGLLSATAGSASFTYQLAAFTGNNALVTPVGQKATVTLTTPTALANLSLLVFSTEQSKKAVYTLTFDDGSNSVLPAAVVDDWYSSATARIGGYGRVVRNNDSNFTAQTGQKYFGNELALTCAEQKKKLTSITVDAQALTPSNTTGNVVLLAASGVAADVDPGTISGATTLEIAKSTSLSNPTPGGSWTSSDTAIATVDATTGKVTAVAPGAVTITYKLPGSCSTPATHNITIKAAQPPVTAVAQPDSGSVRTGTGGTAVVNVAANDTVNGAAATLGAGGNATVATSGAWPAGITLDPATGGVNVAATVGAGNYSMTYQLCDRLTPPHCTTAQVTVTVSSVVAQPDTGAVTVGAASTAVANIAANDSINGAPATLGAGGNATVAANGTWPAGITLDPATGAVNVAATVAAGTYTMNYQLCDRSTPPVCVQSMITAQASLAAGLIGVPTLGQWALLCLGLMMAGLSWREHRRHG